jgi:hypothetical protein
MSEETDDLENLREEEKSAIEKFMTIIFGPKEDEDE